MECNYPGTLSTEVSSGVVFRFFRRALRVGLGVNGSAYYVVRDHLHQIRPVVYKPLKIHQYYRRVARLDFLNKEILRH